LQQKGISKEKLLQDKDVRHRFMHASSEHQLRTFLVCNALIFVGSTTASTTGSAFASSLAHALPT
jgi:hypothetical protein